MLSRYLREVGLAATGVALLYRRFVDWNIKKVFLWAYALAASVVLSVPFVVLVGLIGYANPDLITNLSVLAAGVEAGRPVAELADAVAAAALPVAGIALAVGGIVLAFFLGFAYSLALLSRAYLGYLRGETVSVRSLPLASPALLWRVLGAFAWQGLLVLGFIVAAAAWFLLARFALGIGSALFYGISGFAAIAAFAYLTVRLSFVAGALGEDTDRGGAALARECFAMLREPTAFFAFATAVPYFIFFAVLRYVFVELGGAESLLGSVAWFLAVESAEVMVFASIWRRIREGKFFAK